MHSERDHAERQLDERKARLKTADERRKAAVSEVYSALLCAFTEHCTWHTCEQLGAARGRARHCRRGALQWFGAMCAR